MESLGSGAMAAPDLAFCHDDNAPVSYSSAYHPNGTPLSPGRFSSLKDRGLNPTVPSSSFASHAMTGGKTLQPIEMQQMENGVVLVQQQSDSADSSRRPSLVDTKNQGGALLPSAASSLNSTAAISTVSDPAALASSSPSDSPLPPPPASSSTLSHRLGFLSLSILRGRGINGKDERGDSKDGGWKQKTAVEVTYAGCTYKSEFQPGSNPTYGLRLHLPVYDITTDVVIHFILKHSIKKNECFGMVVVPLAVMLNRQRMWTNEAGNDGEDVPSTQSIAMLRGPSETDETALATTTVPGVSTSTPSASSSSSSSIPVSSSLGSRASSLLHSLFSPRRFHFLEWLQLYPYNFDHAGSLWLNRFPAAEDTILQSGMERPKKELGRVQVALDLRLEQPLSYAYQIDPRLYEYSSSALVGANGALIPPMPSPSNPVLLRPEEPADFHKTVMKKNVKRIRRWMELPFWFEVAQTVFTWEIPILTFYFAVGWSYVCFYMPAWQYPLFLMLSCLLTNIWIKRFALEDYAYIHTYQDDAAPSSHLGEGSWKKFQRYKGVVAKISHGYREELRRSLRRRQIC